MPRQGRAAVPSRRRLERSLWQNRRSQRRKPIELTLAHNLPPVATRLRQRQRYQRLLTGCKASRTRMCQWEPSRPRSRAATSGRSKRTPWKVLQRPNPSAALRTSFSMARPGHAPRCSISHSCPPNDLQACQMHFGSGQSAYWLQKRVNPHPLRRLPSSTRSRTSCSSLRQTPRRARGAASSANATPRVAPGRALPVQHVVQPRELP